MTGTVHQAAPSLRSAIEAALEIADAEDEALAAALLSDVLMRIDRRSTERS